VCVCFQFFSHVLYLLPKMKQEVISMQSAKGAWMCVHLCVCVYMRVCVCVSVRVYVQIFLHLLNLLPKMQAHVMSSACTPQKKECICGCGYVRGVCGCVWVCVGVVVGACKCVCV